jgi:hypothetical protein
MLNGESSRLIAKGSPARHPCIVLPHGLPIPGKRYVLAWLLAGLVTPASLSARLGPDTLEAVQQLRFNDAAELVAGEPDDAHRLAAALLLLSRQPRTRTNIDSAQAALQALAADPGTSAELRPWAFYHLARILHWHLDQTPRAATLAAYQRLIDEHPAHPAAQLAQSRRLLLALFAPASAEESKARLLQFEKEAPVLTERDARYAYHVVFSEAYQRFAPEAPELAEHTRRALAIRPLTPTQEADLLLRLAESARHRGDPVTARANYEAFLHSYPRQIRRPLVQKRLEELAP